MNILPRILYLFQTIPIKLGKKYFEDLNKIILKYIWQHATLAPPPGQIQPLCLTLLFLFFPLPFLVYLRTFIYSFLQRGRPFPLKIMFFSALFCIYNGFLQGYYMVYCAEYPDDWCKDIRFLSGLLLFLSGMGINIHSDFLLRQLRKPGEFTYKIPQGGLFAYVSGANFFGEILEWFGYAIATWSLPALAFAFFTLTCVGPRAYHHHRYFYAQFLKQLHSFFSFCSH
uniref:3-oxo-5alpha-steroid 4-dehydrogenase (NADP(+)) n=1 Tax=Laticauda laticaudata TaxID=8630 RepID=A0A8C5RNZ3_LATLA